MALDEAERLDMNVWIYDENSYPSGFAGGLRARGDARSRAAAAWHFARSEAAAEARPTTCWRVYRLDGDAAARTSPTQVRAGETLPEGRYLVASVARAEQFALARRPLLRRPAVSRRDREVPRSHARAPTARDRRPIRQARARLVHRRAATPPGRRTALDRRPARRSSRSAGATACSDNLPSLDRPVGDWKQVRHNYFQVLLELFIEHWAKPYYEYCEKNKLEFTGHYWEHEWPNCVGVPDNMAMYAWHQRPAIDCLMNQYREDTHAQFGNVRMVKELSSVANQLGRKRTLCEAYGAGGWDLRFEDMKRIGDWLTCWASTRSTSTSPTSRSAAPASATIRSRSPTTSRGGRRTTSWPSTSRGSRPAMSQGEQVNRMLVIEPTTTAWMYQADGTQAEQLKQTRRRVSRRC